MTNITAFIFARGGSKGLPGKNVRPFVGKPLIGWAIEQALGVPEIKRVIVSTDSQEIAEIARGFGADVPFLRPSELASDTSSEVDAWRHALAYLQDTEKCLPDVFVSVPTTAPLRLPEDIERCLRIYTNEKADVVLTVSPAHRNPWFNMVSIQTDGKARLINNLDGYVTRRQDAPEAFDITTVAYVASPDFILSGRSLFSGCVRAAKVPVERAIDIDTLHDFEIAEFLMRKRLEESA
ncbi:acylneuraminate cytidylyltransferase family protein [Marinobacter salarius]|jgi:N-acylneuraminate cytidylyltransferase|uniref:acylneuraminate cytidylyltransferase family protein n=1 Tax=Marinobacter salarius TaxID=1420917 RepID=UPI003213C982